MWHPTQWKSNAGVRPRSNCAALSRPLRQITFFVSGLCVEFEFRQLDGGAMSFRGGLRARRQGLLLQGDALATDLRCLFSDFTGSYSGVRQSSTNPRGRAGMTRSTPGNLLGASMPANSITETDVRDRSSPIADSSHKAFSLTATAQTSCRLISRWKSGKDVPQSTTSNPAFCKSGSRWGSPRRNRLQRRSRVSTPQPCSAPTGAERNNNGMTTTRQSEL